MRKKLGKIAVVSFLFVLLSVLSACGYTAEEQREIKQYRKTAEQNAVSYIEEKYGFTSEVLGSECEVIKVEFSLNIAPEPTGDVYVELYDEEKDKSFWVYTTGKEVSRECWDNYQYEEIEAAVEKQMDVLLGIEAKHTGLEYGKFCEDGKRVQEVEGGSRRYGLVQDFFDGNNLAQVLGNADYNKMVVCIVNEKKIPDLLECTIGEMTEAGVYEGTLTEVNPIVHCFGNNVNCLFINYRNIQAYEHVHKDGCEAYFPYYNLSDSVENRCFYVKEQYNVSSLRDGEEIHTEYGEYILKQFDNFYYVPVGGTYCEFINAEDDMVNASVWNGSGFRNAQKIYDAYRIDSDAKHVYLFIPIEALESGAVSESTIEDDVVRIVRQHYYNDKEKGWVFGKSTCSTYFTGDAYTSEGRGYLTTDIYLHDFYKDIIFSVLLESDESK